MAAKPVLASDLIAKDSIGLFEERARKRPRVGTGCCASVDAALSGGLVYGQDGIYNISGATGSRAAETVSFVLDATGSPYLHIGLQNEQKVKNEMMSRHHQGHSQLTRTLQAPLLL